jgi:hypothetical protein
MDAWRNVAARLAAHCPKWSRPALGVLHVSSPATAMLMLAKSRSRPGRKVHVRLVLQSRVPWETGAGSDTQYLVVCPSIVRLLMLVAGVLFFFSL